MGSAFELAVVAASSADAELLLNSGVEEISRLESMLSEFVKDSELSRINRNAAQEEVVVREETFNLLLRCKQISQMTHGAFDITTSPLKALYKFQFEHLAPPDSQKIEEVLKIVGYKKMKLNAKRSSVRFEVPGMKISLAAIGKGYASDSVLKFWKSKGLKAGYVSASGDIAAFGLKPDGTRWKVAIEDPRQIDQVLMEMPLVNTCVATSGDAQQHFFYQGKKYSHNISPFSGEPLSGIGSVTVFSPSAELSDALATAVYVKGITAGIRFVNALPQTHALIIDDTGKIYASKNIKYGQEAA